MYRKGADRTFIPVWVRDASALSEVCWPHLVHKRKAGFLVEPLLDISASFAQSSSPDLPLCFQMNASSRRMSMSSLTLPLNCVSVAKVRNVSFLTTNPSAEVLIPLTVPKPHSSC